IRACGPPARAPAARRSAARRRPRRDVPHRHLRLLRRPPLRPPPARPAAVAEQDRRGARAGDLRRDVRVLVRGPLPGLAHRDRRAAILFTIVVGYYLAVAFVY